MPYTSFLAVDRKAIKLHIALTVKKYLLFLIFFPKNKLIYKIGGENRLHFHKLRAKRDNERK